jgi:hypothetical protein
MNILNQSQYNQGIGKYKLLSSNAGVGSIITTKMGSYVLILDINKWKFIEWANKKIETIREEESDSQKIYDRTKIEIKKRGLLLVDDIRFVKFLKIEKNLDSLVCLIDIPHMTLNDNFNTPNWKNHPIRTALKKNEEKGFASDYMINAAHFPKWFINKKGKLKKIDEWKKIWSEECKKQNGVLENKHFAPPRDGSDFIKEFDAKNLDGYKVKNRVYQILNQTNIVLICPDGHLSDVPWSKYINWKINHKIDDSKANNLLTYDSCCTNPKLKWSESTNKSEGYGSIYVQCDNCGTGKDSAFKVNLEGINSIEPFCDGEKPWEQELDNNFIPKERCTKQMRIALVTANNVYYASGFSSLFIPIHLAENKTKELVEAVKRCNIQYNMTIGKTYAKPKEIWFNQKVDEEFLETNCNISIAELKEGFERFIEILRNEFLMNQEGLNKVDNFENYRWQEYQCFVNNRSILELIDNNGLKFNDIELPSKLKPFFSKIQQVEELKVTQLQLDFTRVEPRDRIVKDGIVEYSKDAKNIFSNNLDKQFVLPANESLGEGLFFQFNESELNDWFKNNEEILSGRFNRFMTELATDIQGAMIMRKIFNNGVKHFVIHSFSHMIMRELEFSCGYPTASLKERLYISNNLDKQMSGVLIYTAEGSEGSMGGLVSQGEPDRISNIIKKGLYRINNCSSDPLCWESDGQGIFDLNLAACFSCSLVSETACEELNLGLDRRVLIDSKFGFFNKLV